MSLHNLHRESMGQALVQGEKLYKVINPGGLFRWSRRRKIGIESRPAPIRLKPQDRGKMLKNFQRF